MKITLAHKIKLMIARVRWFFYIAGIAAFHRKHVKNFQFLFDVQTELKYAILQAERETEDPTEKKDRLYAQQRIVDKIINIIIGE